jgi:hypothetical protein
MSSPSAKSGFAASAFANQAEGLAGLQFEADVIDSLNVALYTTEQPLFNGEMDLETPNF